MGDKANIRSTLPVLLLLVFFSLQASQTGGFPHLHSPSQAFSSTFRQRLDWRSFFFWVRFTVHFFTLARPPQKSNTEKKKTAFMKKKQSLIKNFFFLEHHPHFTSTKTHGLHRKYAIHILKTISLTTFFFSSNTSKPRWNNSKKSKWKNKLFLPKKFNTFQNLHVKGYHQKFFSERKTILSLLFVVWKKSPFAFRKTYTSFWKTHTFTNKNFPCWKLITSFFETLSFWTLCLTTFFSWTLPFFLFNPCLFFDTPFSKPFC